MRKQNNVRWKKHWRQMTARCLLLSVAVTPLAGSVQAAAVYGAPAVETAGAEAAGQEAASDGENPAGQTVEISTAEELSEFAKKCQSTVYSRNMTAVLTADIDVKGNGILIPFQYSAEYLTEMGTRLQDLICRGQVQSAACSVCWKQGQRFAIFQ